MRLTSKLIDGSFPDYTRVIPAANDKLVTLDAALFKAAVDRVSIISSDKSRAVKLTITPGLLSISAHNTDASSANEELEIEYQGEALEIGFNARYLLDITDQIQGDVLQMELADPGAPSLIRTPGDEASLFVLMPMRV